MLIQEKVLINGREFQKTYSDNKHYIKQKETGYLYDIAIDVYPVRFSYEETDVVIEEREEL